MTLNSSGSLSEKSKNILEKTLKSLSHEPRIPFAFFFGSYANGRETILSDIDIAIYFNGIDEDEKAEYEHRLWLLFDEQGRKVGDCFKEVCRERAWTCRGDEKPWPSLKQPPQVSPCWLILNFPSNWIKEKSDKLH